MVKALSEFSAAIKSEDVLTGVHCCGNTDWSIFTAVKSIDIISFDAFSFLDKFVLYAQDLKDFLKRGGIICWGIVPTQEFSGKETAQLLTDKITAGIDILAKKGLSRNLLLENLLLSPACGLGTLDTKKAESIFNLLQQTSSIIKNSG
ncbi:MAG: hypothetical protein HZC16_00110 [Candidatus Omnitrophica bacterium]|nr:hypothetical protein [Candidatus Omnitrophota bacterium]